MHSLSGVVQKFAYSCGGMMPSLSGVVQKIAYPCGGMMHLSGSGNIICIPMLWNDTPSMVEHSKKCMPIEWGNALNVGAGWDRVGDILPTDMKVSHRFECRK